jgi:8-hydroxy-5-deazaflavin:NADPH oxidoreductase
MKIGIIGAGHVGSTLARLFIDADHDVTICNSRDPQTLTGLVREMDGHLQAATPAQTAAHSDVIVLAIPFGHYHDLPARELAGKTVVDATNYHARRDGHIAELDGRETTSSELIQRHLNDSAVVKAFNAMRWDHLRDYRRPSGSPTRYGIPVSGDADEPKHTVIDLIEQVGYEPVDAGGLAEGGRKHEPHSPIYTVDLPGPELSHRIGVDRR